jgi:hypothetical protein
METVNISPLGNHELCLTKGSSVRIADTNYESGSVIAYQHDRKMYFLHPGEIGRRKYARLIPNTDVAIVTDEQLQKVSIIDDFSKKNNPS